MSMSVDSPSPTADALDGNEPLPRLPNRVGPTQPARVSMLRSDIHVVQSPKTGFARVKGNLGKINELYTYSKIDDGMARLLTVQPKQFNRDNGYTLDDIYATLSVVPLEELGQKSYKYEALSYFWGREDANNVVHLRNETRTSEHQKFSFPEVVRLTKHKKSRIKPNLYQALLHLRQEVHPARYWIDALCMDQSNRKEKEVQVANMDRIYARAERVLIWLGPSNDRTKRAMLFIERVIDLNGKDAAFGNNCVDDWSDFLHLLEREWFSRRWVIQELAFARDPIVLCGEDSKHWVDLRDAVSIFAHKADKVRELFKRSAKYGNDYNAIEESQALGARVLVESINNIFRSADSGKVYEPVQGLEYLVSTLFGFECSDPRDTIHALQNLAKETSPTNGKRARRKGHQLPGPDYEKTLLLVYVEFIRWVEKRTGNIDILCRHWALPERKLSEDEREIQNYPKLVALPTWIQQISNSPFGRQQESRGRIHGDSFVGLPGHGTYNACHGRKACVQYGAFPEILANDKSPRRAISTIDVFAESLAQPIERADNEHSTASVDQQAESNIQAKHHAQDSNGATLLSPVIPAARQAKRSYDSASNDTDVPPAKTSRSSAGRSPTRQPSSNIGIGTTMSQQRTNAPIRNGANISLDQAADGEQERLNIRNGTLWVEGLLIGVIDWLTDPMPDGVVPANVLQKLGHDTTSNAAPNDKLWRTLVAERGADGRNSPAWYSRACRHCLVNDSPNGHINTKELLSKDQPDIVREFLKRVHAVTWNRVLLEVRAESPTPPGSDAGDMSPLPNRRLSDAGRADISLGAPRIEIQDTSRSMPPGTYMQRPDLLASRPTSSSSYVEVDERLHGLGPSEARKDDIVCILFGCSVPCILRPQIDDSGAVSHYLFIGEVYIYGLMDGEAVMSKTEDQIQKKKMRIEIH